MVTTKQRPEIDQDIEHLFDDLDHLGKYHFAWPKELNKPHVWLCGVRIPRDSLRIPLGATPPRNLNPCVACIEVAARFGFGLT